MEDNDRIAPWLGATDQTIDVYVRSLGELMHDGMQVAGSCEPWWTYRPFTNSCPRWNREWGASPERARDQ